MWGMLPTCWKACSRLRSFGCEKLLPCAAWLIQNWSHRRHLIACPKVICLMGWALSWSQSGEHDQGTLGRTQKEARGSLSAIQKHVIYTGISFQNTRSYRVNYSGHSISVFKPVIYDCGLVYFWLCVGVGKQTIEMGWLMSQDFLWMLQEYNHIRCLYYK